MTLSLRQKFQGLKILARALTTGRVLSDDMLEKQFFIAERQTSDSANQIDDLVEQVQDHLRAEDWDALDRKLSILDQTRAHAMDGTRLAPIILEAVWNEVKLRARQESEKRSDQTVAQLFHAVMEPFLKAAEIREDRYAINALIGHLCLQVGWEVRGCGYAEHVGKTQFRIMREQFENAARYLAKFNPTEMNSPLLAEIHYTQLSSIETSLPKLNEAYYLRRNLDPNDARIRYDHAFKLLPRWYGDYDKIDGAARAAYDASKASKGATEYAEFYLYLIGLDSGALQTVDMDLFETGLIDKIERSNTPQEILNTILSVLSDVPDEYSDSTDLFRCRKQFAAIEGIQCRLVRTHLEVATPQLWPKGRDHMLYKMVDLSRFDAAPLIAFTATKETNYGTETDGRISPRCGAHRADQWAYAQTGC